MDGSSQRRRIRFQFRLATLFWLAFSVAVFFAGRHWDEVSSSLVRLLSSDKTHLRLATGSSSFISSGGKITQAQVNDPGVCSVVPLSPQKLQVSGVSVGDTTVDIWDEGGVRTSYRITVHR